VIGGNERVVRPRLADAKFFFDQDRKKTLESRVEGLGKVSELHPLQESFRQHHALQCGFCTPGMLMTGVDFLEKHPDATDNEIREGLSGNLCRCTGYEHIVAAVRDAAAKKKEAGR